MPLFFFELDDGLRRFDDFEGSEHASAEEARQELVGALAMLAKDELPDGNIRDFRGVLRDHSRKVVFNATLSLRSGWVE
ncbi:DUF6894 family protein [Methylobacterium gnaphalii]|uniref:DUF6894 domain-containing protein n=1 Tax=Methylobacterium gnaphalii TaxID=1010610 RepID=A0A512JJJ4_9HYPH|nr:hypothetical protein [Methylobacterium gnaphalii]GEP10120.1 hypothetical protein MGN01_19650 [Methylobacterium gnaphalii]GJD71700.1 hypothetical protein MMMDOFMJ_4663 [Methylobacterium gnaphalii]GLS48390.1 hypothetical protein GCM10007885_12340 [Methylobacterium gnaphalii]